MSTLGHAGGCRRRKTNRTCYVSLSVRRIVTTACGGGGQCRATRNDYLQYVLPLEETICKMIGIRPIGNAV